MKACATYQHEDQLLSATAVYRRSRVESVIVTIVVHVIHCMVERLQTLPVYRVCTRWPTLLPLVSWLSWTLPYFNLFERCKNDDVYSKQLRSKIRLFAVFPWNMPIFVSEIFVWRCVLFRPFCFWRLLLSKFFSSKLITQTDNLPVSCPATSVLRVIIHLRNMGLYAGNGRFPANHFPGQTFPGQDDSRKDVSRTSAFPDSSIISSTRRFPDNLYKQFWLLWNVHVAGQTMNCLVHRARMIICCWLFL